LADEEVDEGITVILEIRMISCEDGTKSVLCVVVGFVFNSVLKCLK
jgi:hypothetical protein